MVASTDLHQQPQAQHSPHTSPWGTWEELLLASAVQRYGRDNWALISAELQSRTQASFTFTPELSLYREESDGIIWFEELRRLRVAQLKRELEQYDSSIGSLEKKIRELQAERAESNSQKSLSVDFGVIELERDQYDACKLGTNAALLEADVSGRHTHSGSMKKVSAKIKENAEGKTQDSAGATMPIASLASDKRVRVLGLNAEAYGESQAKVGLESGKTESSVTKVPNAFKAKLNSSSKWEDSTNRKRQHVPAAKNLYRHQSVSKEELASKNVSCELLVGKVKAEMLTMEDAMSEPSVYKMDGGMQTLASRELAITNPQLKDHGADSEGRTRKLTLSVIEGSDEKSDASVPLTPAEVSVKSESISINNEVSNSVQACGSPGANDDSLEAWHPLERLSGDSKTEKSELDSYVDLNEDVSPTSKTNQEPKVCGKLLPLLVSLRNVCAHRCAPLFKHQRESQDSSELAAASGLRECIMREMESISETGLLVKREGPTFRKRDSGKARQRSPVKKGGAQMILPAVIDEPLTEVASTGCNAVLNVGGTGDQSNAKGPAGDGATTTAEEKDENSLDVKRLLDSKFIKPKSLTSRTAFEDTKESLADEDWRKTPAGPPTGVSSITKGPFKRGVGRPPKHAHDQDSQKGKEASISPQKRLKR